MTRLDKGTFKRRGGPLKNWGQKSGGVPLEDDNKKVFTFTFIKITIHRILVTTICGERGEPKKGTNTASLTNRIIPPQHRAHDLRERRLWGEKERLASFF